MNGDDFSRVISPDPALLRRQALLSCLAAFGTSLLYFVADFPYTEKIALMALIAAVIYGVFYVFFKPIHARFARSSAAFLSGAAVILLAFVVHYSGGVASPFVFLYFCILISEAVYGLENPVTLPLAAGTYFLVCVGECSGLLAPANPWAAAVCENKVFAGILIGTTITFMWITRYITGLILKTLRGSLEREHEEKDTLIKKFSELNSTTQIGVLAHRIAHDLRAPMAAISGYIQIEMLKDKGKAEAAALAELNDVVNGMAESLQGITRFGRTSRSEPEPVALVEFMDNLLAIVLFSHQVRGIRFVKRYPARSAVTALVSRHDLQQACFNILKNAVEAVRDNSDAKVVEVDVRAEGKDALITVSDNGPGIVPEILKTLFRKSITTKKEGTGVGLMITRDLLMRCDGDIQLNNRAEGGLTAVVRLPLFIRPGKF
ncbi:MAG: hypothetical protein A2X31_07790 [Elusimicrobia bacterium GWB2_63_22]|nr:MAG: hypothetical protein A2X31_07790 [Elusimicrobia bacterium GWB2_63_22]